MKFEPTPQEWVAGVNYSTGLQSDLNQLSLAVSGSHWDDAHLSALHVVIFDELPTHRLFPITFLPNEQHTGERESP
jgi:hypothetical protein